MKIPLNQIIVISEPKDSNGNILFDYFEVKTNNSTIDMKKLKEKYECEMAWKDVNIEDEIDNLLK